MLQRSSLPSSVSTELTDSLQQTFDRRRLEKLQEMLWLPENARQYLILLAAVLAVGAGMMVHVWLNVRVADEQYRLGQLVEQMRQIERENSELIYAIAQSTTLDRVKQAAVQQGYRPATERVYLRRDQIASVTGSRAAATAPALPATANTPAPRDDAPPATGFLDAAGRGLGAVWGWLQQATQAAAQTIDESTLELRAGFLERWMP